MSESALIDRLRPGDHVSWIVEDDTDHERLLAAYVRGAVLADHKVGLFLDDAAPQRTLAGLAASGLDVDHLTGRGQLEILDTRTAYLDDGGVFDGETMIERCEQAMALARAQGYAGLRLLGDTGWACGPLVEELTGYEERINRIFLDGFLIGTCVYDRRRFDRDQLSAVVAAHPATVDATYDARPDGGAGWEPLLRFRRIEGGLRLEGEVDVSNRAAVVSLLDHVAATRSIAASAAGGQGRVAPLRLDVRRLTFLDVASACHLVDVAARTGGLRLIGAAPQLVRLLAALGAHRAPGLVVEEG